VALLEVVEVVGYDHNLNAAVDVGDVDPFQHPSVASQVYDLQNHNMMVDLVVVVVKSIVFLADYSHFGYFQMIAVVAFVVVVVAVESYQMPQNCYYYYFQVMKNNFDVQIADNYSFF
jgi:glucan phosphoethanolaminetransferase (alkaline phosphatase superfamily)